MKEKKEFHATDYRSRRLYTRMHTLLVTDVTHVVFQGCNMVV